MRNLLDHLSRSPLILLLVMIVLLLALSLFIAKVSAANPKCQKSQCESLLS
jgi:hypothetical protein